MLDTKCTLDAVRLRFDAKCSASYGEIERSENLAVRQGFEPYDRVFLTW